ncbi:MAG TPA: ABC transporter substrate-binding protein, partial [Tepidisphaeraceae bacterium]|nr:ABC transporter substrate-binding protein [Tepidisphaeraceae bacterium]
MLRLLTIPVALLALLAGAMVWSSKGQGPPADFTFTQRGDNKTLDLGVMSWMQDMRIAYALWEGLYTPDPVTLLPIPGSADRIETNADKTVYTFHIRDNARWSNGEPLRAADFQFGWRRMLEQPAEYTYLHEYIKGAKDYEDAYARWKQDIAAGRKTPKPDYGMVGVEVLGEKTLRVTLAHPVPFFTSLCAFPCFFPQYEPCMRAFAQWNDPDPKKRMYVASYDEAFTRPPNLVTNGPYRLADWSFKRRLRMIANDYYWDRAHVRSRIV